MKQASCPTCKRLIKWSPENKWRPFCSERCKLIDLGAWAAEKRAIPGDAKAAEDPASFPPDAENPTES